VSPDGGTFLRNVWPMYVHELSGFGADFYRLDTTGRRQPDIVQQVMTRITPAGNSETCVRMITRGSPSNAAT
jgi:hypothetical protein